MYIGLGSALTIASFFVIVTFAQSAYPPSPSSADRSSDFPLPGEDLSQDQSYDKPIIFFREDTHILVLYPNGDIVHRGRKVTTDQDVVRAMQEILALSPCRVET
jgi:hypothetical protein